MKSLFSTAALVLILVHTHGQERLTLSECYTLAEANYPLIRQKELISLSKSLSLESAAKGYLPQILVGGQATYQSEVTQIPVEMPGVDPLGKDQYKIFGEFSQALYHGGLVRQQEQLAVSNSVVESEKLAIELYQLRNRINDLFFGIILLQEQTAQSELVKMDISSGLQKSESAIANGSALQSSADVLKAEILMAEQRIIELQSAISAYKKILGLFINRHLNDRVVLEKPEISIAPDITRIELRLYDYQKQSIDVNREILSASKRPRLELFAQGGYGRPGLNMLENKFNFFYLGGIRFNWLLSGFYAFGREKELLNIKQQSIDVQKETFLFNTKLALIQHEAEIRKLQQLIGVDKEIIELRRRVKQTFAVQLEQGVISSSDYIREVNAEDRAKQNLVLHETQWLMAKAKYQFTSGN